jgi:hypothetical protein
VVMHSIHDQRHRVEPGRLTYRHAAGRTLGALGGRQSRSLLQGSLGFDPRESGGRPRVLVPPPGCLFLTERGPDH